MAKTLDEKKKELEAKKLALKKKLAEEMKKLSAQERNLNAGEKKTLRKERNHGMYLAMGALMAEWKKTKSTAELTKLISLVPAEKKRFIELLIKEIKG